MKLSIGTIKFQEMVAKAAKGASENKLLPITSLMAIQLKGNVLKLTTTDTANTLEIITDKIQGDDFYAVVPVEVFSKLVAKTTSENITLTLKENSLEVKGDGTYNIPLPVDEDGVVKFPEPKFKKSRGGVAKVINLTTIKNILAINKAAVAKTVDTPCLCGYYVGDKVITTDENVICFNDMKLFEDGAALISPEMMELLSLNTQE
jgi:DNA polymerase III sliding clamp (beta) subunit (PCNA family)